MSLLEVQYQAHRAKFPVTPQTTMIQVLEDACAKFNLHALNFELKHGTKRIDLSARFGMSGLAKNAKLDLAKLDKPRDESQPVTIAVQLENGQRVRGDYQCDRTLMSILSDLKASGKIDANLDDEPIENDASRCMAVVYTQEEVIGKFALEHTTLKQIGVLSGTALLRIAVRRVEAQQLATIRHAIEKRESDRKQLELDQQRRAAQAQAELHSSRQQAAEVAPSESFQPEAFPTPAVGNPFSTSIFEDRPPAGVSMFDNQPTGVSMFDNPVASLGGWSFDKAPDNGANHAVSKGNVQSQSSSLGQMIGHTLEPSVVSANPSDMYQFADFKFPEQTRGMDLTGTARTTSDSDSSSRRFDVKSAVDREAFCYSLDSQDTSDAAELAQQSSEVAVLPDQFFEVTEADVRCMLASMRRELARIQEEPLMTKEMRNRLKEQRAKAYRRCIVRVHFVDRYVLQGAFLPSESVASLYAFVQAHLADQNASFYLYTSPPKCVLDNYEASLIISDLVPLSVVYCTVTAPKDGSRVNTSGSLSPSLLKSELIEAAKSVTVHNADVRAMRSVWSEDDFNRLLEVARNNKSSEGTQPQASDNQQASAMNTEDGEDGVAPQARTVHVAGSSWKQSSSSQIGQSSNVPKWFKPR